MLHDDVLVSVIVPTWNRGKTLEKCIRSIMSQSYKNLEIIVSDDFSTDNTEEIVKSINDPRLVFIKGARGGRPAIPRNKGLKIAKGEWIAFCDSDDYWLNDKIAKQLEDVRQNNVLASCTNGYLDNTENIYFKKKSECIDTFDLIKKNEIICSSLFIKKNLIKKIGYFSEEEEFAAFEDYQFWLRVSLYTKIYYNQTPLLRYTTQSPDSVRKDNFNESLTKRWRVLTKFKKLCWDEKKITIYIFLWAVLVFEKCKNEIRIIIK